MRGIAVVLALAVSSAGCSGGGRTDAAPSVAPVTATTVSTPPPTTPAPVPTPTARPTPTVRPTPTPRRTTRPPSPTPRRTRTSQAPYIPPPPPATADRYVAPTPTASRYVSCRKVRTNTWAVTWTVTLQGGEGWRFQDPNDGRTATYTREMGWISNAGDPPPSKVEFTISEAFVFDEHAGMGRTLTLPQSLRRKATCTQ